jgi:diaminopimelate epimerase
LTRLHKVSGGGNDFLVLAEPDRDPTAAEIVAWCARGLSFGADGLFTLRRAGGNAVRMDYWNADGRSADLCINGTRCAARLALDLGWAQGRVRVETGAGPIEASPAGQRQIALELPAPEDLPRRLRLELPDRAVEGWSVPIGVPHFVVVWPSSLADCPVAELGAALRSHPAFGAIGTNVDFVRFPERHRLEIRSFERGVEAETLACGTGVLAAVATGLQLERAELPVRVQTRGGFVLTVAGETVDSVPSRWTLAGDARLLGTVETSEEAALSPPPPPRWSD